MQQASGHRRLEKSHRELAYAAVTLCLQNEENNVRHFCKTLKKTKKLTLCRGLVLLSLALKGFVQNPLAALLSIVRGEVLEGELRKVLLVQLSDCFYV
jgi:hypothetical protein